MKLDSILICPACGGGLKKSGLFYHCANFSCGERFPIRRRIPLLLAESKLDGRKRKEREVFDDLTAYNELMGRPYFQDLKSRLTAKLADFGLKGKTVLEIGAGTSLFLPLFVKANNLFASDINYSLISQSKTKAALVVADAENLPFANASFDFVYLIGLLHHLTDQRRAWREIKRVLKKDGRFFVSEPTRQSLNLVYYLLRRLALKLMGEARLKKLIGCGSPDESFVSLEVARAELGQDFDLRLTYLMPLRLPPLRLIEDRFSVAKANSFLEKTFLKRFGTIVWLEGKRRG